MRLGREKVESWFNLGLWIKGLGEEIHKGLDAESVVGMKVSAS